MSTGFCLLQVGFAFPCKFLGIENLNEAVQRQMRFNRKNVLEEHWSPSESLDGGPTFRGSQSIPEDPWSILGNM